MMVLILVLHMKFFNRLVNLIHRIFCILENCVKSNCSFCIFFIAFGAGAAAVAQENALGTLSRMGPGFFPTALGVILALLGCCLSLRALLFSGYGDGSLEGVNWGVLGFILGSVAVFAVSLLELGVLLSIALMIVISSLASGRFRAREVAVLTVFMCLLCWVIFIFGVGLQVPVLPAFL